MAKGLFARIDGQDFELIDFDADWVVDQANTFSIDVLAKEFAWRNSMYSDVEIYDGKDLVISGFVDKSPKLEMKDGGPLVVALSCLDELGRLTCDRAKFDAHYQDQQVLSILTDLISVATIPWVLSLVNMVDPLVVTTIDLRSKETLFAQIVETVKSTPQVHLRYGGQQITGEHVLEVGNFGDVNAEGIQGHNLLGLKLNYNTEKMYRIVESYGDSTLSQKISLFDALSDARTAVHPDYAQFPISLDAATGSYIVTNAAISEGCSVRKSFNVIKVKNDTTPTAAEVAEAGYALWLKTVRFMQKSTSYETYSAEVLLPSQPDVGDNMFIRSVVREPVYDAMTGKIVAQHETFEVNDDFRITKVGFTTEQVALPDGQYYDLHQQELVYSIELTSNDEAEMIDPDAELFARLEDHTEFDDVGASLVLYPIQSTTLTYNSTNAADCNGSGVLTGKLFLHTSPVPPVGATGVITWYVANPGNMDIYNYTPPAVVGNNWSACIQPNGGNWPPPVGVNYTVTVYWQFT